MGYEVEVSETIERKIASWELDGDIHALLYEAMIVELADGTLNGIRSVAPVVFQTHRLYVPCPKTSAIHGFKLWVNETQKVGVRRILEIQRVGYAGVDSGMKTLPPTGKPSPFTTK